MTAPRFDRKALIDRINATQVQMDAVGAEHRRLVRQLARLPDDDPEPAPAPLRRGVPLKIGETRSGKHASTLIRHGKRLDFVWLAGGRWQIDLAGLDAWMAGHAAQS